MSSIITLILIGISLSMDAFSLSFAYGISGISKKNKLKLSVIVGIYHFFMPLLGFLLSNILSKINIIDIDIIAFIILTYVGINIIFTQDNVSTPLNNIGFILFGISVSLDSLTVGISLKAITNILILPSLIFSITSFLFTILGLTIGTYLGNKIKFISKLFGGIILIIISIIILIK